MFQDSRFIPYLQRHEFEALVLASVSALRYLLDADDDVKGLARLASTIRGLSPEDINDGASSAPSKRLLDCVPGYRKTLHGPEAVAATGMLGLRACCPRFDAWVSRLEALKSEFDHSSS
jgi:hypothetical protein